jgi:Arc/MetJ-type ribon-helix-helix transcriptional regulator
LKKRGSKFLGTKFGVKQVKLRANYTTVKIPQELAAELDEFVPNMGYRSRAEIVNDAIRRFIDERKRLDYSVAANQSEGTRREQKRNDLIKVAVP